MLMRQGKNQNKQHTRSNRFFKILNSLLLTAEACALLVVEPAQLLKNLGVVRVALKHARVGRFGGVVLEIRVRDESGNNQTFQLTSFCCSWT